MFSNMEFVGWNNWFIVIIWYKMIWNFVFSNSLLVNFYKGGGNQGMLQIYYILFKDYIYVYIFKFF